MNKQDLIKLKSHITKEWGTKCKDFVYDCQKASGFKEKVDLEKDSIDKK